MIKLYPINTSFKDPQNAVFTDDQNRIIRKIQKEFLHFFNQSNYFSKIIGPVEEDFFEIEKFHFQSFYFEYPFELFKDSALNFLDCLEELIQNDLIYIDGSPLNTTYQGKNRFIHFDLGSVKELNTEYGWIGYKQFLTDWLWMLYHLSDKDYITAGYLSTYLNDNQWIFNEELSLRHKIRPSYWLHQSFLQDQKKVKLNQNAKNNQARKINKNKLIAFITLLKSDVKSARLKKHKTKWDDYYTDTILQNNYLHLKEQKFIEVIQSIIPSGNFHFVDWGANDGHFSRIISNIHPQSTVLSIESDFNAANQLYVKSKDYPIIPIHANVINPIPAIGFANNIPSLLNRIKKVTNVHVVLGLVHHLQHSHNLSHRQIIELFYENSLPDSKIIIEYIGLNDPRYQLIRNINYPHEESLENFTLELSQKYSIIQSISLTDERILFYAQRKDI